MDEKRCNKRSRCYSEPEEKPAKRHCIHTEPEPEPESIYYLPANLLED
jgi:hypothetical protein